MRAPAGAIEQLRALAEATPTGSPATCRRCVVPVPARPAWARPICCWRPAPPPSRGASRRLSAAGRRRRTPARCAAGAGRQRPDRARRPRGHRRQPRRRNRTVRCPQPRARRRRRAGLCRARHPRCHRAGAARPAFAPGAMHAHHPGAAGRRRPPRSAAATRATARPGAGRRRAGLAAQARRSRSGRTDRAARQLDRASLAAQRRVTVPFLRQTLGL